MNAEKLTGSYYTPHGLIEFMVDYLIEEQSDFSCVLEPSAGDGRFLALLKNLAGDIDAVELFEDKYDVIRRKYANEKNVHAINADFIDYVDKTKKRYSLIIGNPPYVNVKNMGRNEIEKAKELCTKADISQSIMKNLWSAFIVGASELVQKNGTIFFVLPMEFLQVQYAEKLREQMEGRFNTIHIISFDEIVFEGIEQDVCLVYMTNRCRNPEHIEYKIYKSISERAARFTNRIQKNKPLKKWSNALLSDKDITRLKNKGGYHTKIRDMGDIAPGIVTGGNKYFIINSEKVAELGCEKMVLPIIQKSSFVDSGRLIWDKKVIKSIREKGKPCFLLDLSKIDKENLGEKLEEYLEWAGEQDTGGRKLKDSYKCANRDPWYGVPIVKKGEVVFFKRYDVLPKVYVNQIDVHTTDAGYHIRLKDGYDAQSMVFCFFNSVTLSECEFQGRYYGGGVEELVPSEFKDIMIPYRKIKDEDIKKLNEMFQEGKSAECIVDFVNQRTICQELSEEEVDKYENIRKRLVNRRKKKLTKR